MAKQVYKKSVLVASTALMYILLVVIWDKYIFETVIIAESWIKAEYRYFNEPQYKKIYNIDEIIREANATEATPIILIWTSWYGKTLLEPQLCSGCIATYDRRAIKTASAVIFHCYETRDDPKYLPWSQRPKNQRWVWRCNEPPWNVRNMFRKTLSKFNGVFNWSMTYRRDSDVMDSYSIPFPFVNKTAAEIIQEKTANALGAWVSSNCFVPLRSDFIDELVRYIKIDRYRKCGDIPLCRGQCEHDTLYRYKFYFSLENSLCKDYISEKFWHQAISHYVVPVVMGPPREEYELVAPPNSFIHVDDFNSIKDLTDYLIKLDNNDTLYGQYLKWMSIPENKDLFKEKNAEKLKNSLKPNGVCALCEKLKQTLAQNESKSEVIANLDDWWFGKGYSRYSFPSCSLKSGQSGWRLEWVVTAGYSLVVLSMLYLLWRTFCRKRLVIRKNGFLSAAKGELS